MANRESLSQSLREYADRDSGYIYENEVAVLRAAADEIDRLTGEQVISPPPTFTIRRRGVEDILIGTNDIDVVKHAALGMAALIAPLDVYDRRFGLIATVEDAEVPVTKPVWTDL